MPIPDGDQVGEWGEPVEDLQVAANSVGELPTTVDEDEQLYPPSRANARKVAAASSARKSRSPRRPQLTGGTCSRKSTAYCPTPKCLLPHHH